MIISKFFYLFLAFSLQVQGLDLEPQHHDIPQLVAHTPLLPPVYDDENEDEDVIVNNLEQ